MSIALDIGCSQMRSLRRQRYRLIGRSCSAVYVAVPESASRRELLDRLGMEYLAADELLVVSGNGAAEVGELLRVPAVPLLSPDRNTLSPETSCEVMTRAIDSLLSPPGEPDEVCCFTAGALADADGGWNDDQEFVAETIRERGYRPLVIGSGMAIVLAGLGRQALTGVGVSFGAGRCEAAVVRQGVELARCVVDRGGDWIDEQLARQQSLYLFDHTGNRYLDLRAARDEKEANAAPLSSPEMETDFLLADLYRELIAETLGALDRALETAPHAFDASQPVPFICAGGTASRHGFGDLVLEEIQKNPPAGCDWQVQVIEAWEYAVARGCLVRAELEEQTLRRRAA